VIACRRHGVEFAMPDGDVAYYEFDPNDDEDIPWDCDLGLPLGNAEPDDDE